MISIQMYNINIAKLEVMIFDLQYSSVNEWFYNEINQKVLKINRNFYWNFLIDQQKSTNPPRTGSVHRFSFENDVTMLRNIFLQWS